MPQVDRDTAARAALDAATLDHTYGAAAGPRGLQGSRTDEIRARSSNH
jgi:hypothetical protein